MKRFIWMVMFAVGLLAVPSPSWAKLRIVTTTSDFSHLARQIGGERVEVHSVMKGQENVHNVLAKPTEMLKLNQADLFVHSGLDAEPWRDNLLKGARNPKVMPGRPGNVEMSAGIELRDVPTGRVDRSQGDIHAFGDPHYHLSPANAERMAATLARAMAEADAANADFYRQNAKGFVVEMADLHRNLKEKLAPYTGLKVVTYHKAWGYFADAFGINIVANVEPKPAITPSPAEVRRLINTMKEQGVKVVVVETYSDHGQANSIAKQAGATAIVLPDHVHGVREADSYQNLFRYNVEKLIDAAKAAGVEPTRLGKATTDAR